MVGSLYDASRLALTALTPEQLAAWHLRTCLHDSLEMRARLVLDTVERQMREAGQAVTIHALWVELADRAGKGGELDVKAAARLAMALRAGWGGQRIWLVSRT